MRILGFDKYTIDKSGNIFSLYKNEYLIPAKNNCGYLFIGLKDNTGKRKYKYIHRLLAEHYIPNPNNFTQVNHIDGNKLNNNLDNLEWCTPSQNLKHAVNLGLIKSGLGNYNHTKVKCNVTGKILSVKEAANEYGCTHQYMSKMLLGQRKNKTQYTYA